MRTISAEAAAVLSGSAVVMVMLVEMDLSVMVRLASSAVMIEYDGNQFMPAGNLGAIERINDAPGEIKPLRFTLSGVPSELLSVALSENIRNHAVRVWCALCDPETNAVLDAPLIWSGTLDQMPISHGKETGAISVTAEHRGATFARPKPIRYTDGDQRRLYPGDTSLQYIQSQSTHRDIWPTAAFHRR